MARSTSKTAESRELSIDSNSTKHRSTNSGALNNLLASSIAAFVSRLCTHPLDTLKTRVQASSKPLPLLPTFLNLVRNGGLYRGLPVALTLSAPGLSVYLTAYDLSKDKFSYFKYLGKDSVLNHLASAATAEVLSGLFWTPMEVLKSKQQVENVTSASPIAASKSRNLAAVGATPKSASSFSTTTAIATPVTAKMPLPATRMPISTMELAKMIYQQEGLIGFYRGYFITLGVFVPYSMMYFASYEQLKEMARQRRGRNPSDNIESDDALPFFTVALCAAVSTGIAGGVSNIVDVVKTRWQVSVLATTEENSSTARIVSNMFRRGGLASFTQGMAARVLWMIPSVTISMSVYEWLKAHGFT
ncbi:hypothetical protein BGX21_008355 [Mortierella sp. AD011]|nr:hypothetical protein BGX20_008556 [Mortierella sp. AD010]KAF9397911.1 hypothetical protein BGX21_008355 [Mortierella sp. AD011]